MKSDWVETVLYWLVYTSGALAAGYHSYVVFAMSDPPLIALFGALALDGVTAFGMYAIKNWWGNQRLAGFVGIILFGFVSGLSQMIARRHGLGEELPAWLAFVSLFLVPLSSVGSIVALGVIRSFKDTGKESKYDDVPTTIREMASGIKSLVDNLSPALARGGGSELDDFTRAELPKLTTEFASEVPAVKRGPGRPRKTGPKL